MELTLFFAVIAGMGAGAAWGYRTALYVALGKIEAPMPRDPNVRALTSGSHPQRREHG